MAKKDKVFYIFCFKVVEWTKNIIKKHIKI